MRSLGAKNPFPPSTARGMIVNARDDTIPFAINSLLFILYCYNLIFAAFTDSYLLAANGLYINDLFRFS